MNPNASDTSGRSIHRSYIVIAMTVGVLLILSLLYWLDCINYDKDMDNYVRSELRRQFKDSNELP